MIKTCTEIIEMSSEQFDMLVKRRDALRVRHNELCKICNENFIPFREIPSEFTRKRDSVWAELESIESLIKEQQLDPITEVMK